MLNVGIIGYGKMGHTRHTAVDASGKAAVRAVYEPGPADTGPLERLGSPEEVLRHPALDAVFICTPNHLNKPLTIAALQAGKHVFCEKPPAFTAAEVEEIRAVEQSSGRKLMYGFNHRHHESVRTMKRLVESGAHGRLLWMRGRYGKSVDESYFRDWRSDRRLAGGGILLDQGIHMLDLFLSLAGDFDEVQAMVSSLYWNLPGIEDNVFANFRNRRTGVVASLHSTMTQWRHLFSLEVFLEKGHFVLNGLKTQSGSYGDEVLTVSRNRSVAPAATYEEEDTTVFHADNSWTDETEVFLEAVIEDRPVQSGGSKDALKVMRLIDAIYETEHHSQEVLHGKLL
jgi:1,5-anhydro-D-fructose reductase (1,5-anhydro-D-mannitol-forming)